MLSLVIALKVFILCYECGQGASLEEDRFFYSCAAVELFEHALSQPAFSVMQVEKEVCS